MVAHGCGAGARAAQINLGALHASGMGMPQDYKAAYAWLSLAATSGSATALQRREEVAQALTTEQLSLAKIEAATLIIKMKNK